MKFNFHTVQSSNISAIAYSANRKVLLVRFTSGNVYSYYDVPKWEYLRLLKADSHGKYHAAHIKDTYKCEYFDFPSANTTEADLLKQLSESVDFYLQQRKKAKQ